MSYKFMFYDDTRTLELTLEEEEENLVEVIKCFNEFLKGCGFDFPGTIELVPFKQGEPEHGEVSTD